MSAAIIAQWHNKVVRFQLYQLSIKRPAIKAKTIDENVIILITQQPVHNRLAENQPTAGLSSLNKYENGMGKSKTELVTFFSLNRTLGRWLEQTANDCYVAEHLTAFLEGFFWIPGEVFQSRMEIPTLKKSLPGEI